MWIWFYSKNDSWKMLMKGKKVYAVLMYLQKRYDKTDWTEMWDVYIDIWCGWEVNEWSESFLLRCKGIYEYKSSIGIQRLAPVVLAKCCSWSVASSLIQSSSISLCLWNKTYTKMQCVVTFLIRLTWKLISRSVVTMYSLYILLS